MENKKVQKQTHTYEVNRSSDKAPSSFNGRKKNLLNK